MRFNFRDRLFKAFAIWQRLFYAIMFLMKPDKVKNYMLSIDEADKKSLTFLG
jgi:hypothetical protein